MVTVRADERVAGREFCDAGHTPRDRATLGRLRIALKGAAGGRRASELRFADAVGVHHVVVPDWDALEERRPVALVGFFGQARPGVDHGPILAIEEDIVARAADVSGLLAYHNARLACGGWGNLVVFESQAATGALAEDPQHVSAVARAPQHYASLRLHRGALTDGCLGEAAIAILETLYFDFAETPAWRAVRRYRD
jgi:hypothetical protein